LSSKHHKLKQYAFNTLGVFLILACLFLMATFLTWNINALYLFTFDIFLWVRISIFAGILITWMEG